MVKRSSSLFLAQLLAVSGFAITSAANAQNYTVGTLASHSNQQVMFAPGTNAPTSQLPVVAEEESFYAQPMCQPGCGDCCSEGCVGYECQDVESEIVFGGWVQMGYHSRVTPAATTANDGGSFNNHPHRFNLHQGWLYAEKVADGRCGLDWGFRMDLMYGVDASDTQSFGNPAGSWDNGGSFGHGSGYGWAIPQLYGELASGNWTIKAGHFYTLVGYEVVTAPDNFFYSHSLTMFNSEPFTHTGVLASYSLGSDTTLYGGWTAGWDSGFDSVNDGSSFLGGFSTSAGANSTFTYITTAGNFGARNNNGGDTNGYAHSIVLDTEIADDLNFVLQSDLVSWGNDDDVGINTYLIKTLTDQLGVGVRTEWWKNDGASQYATTLGINITPAENLIIRPEVRHDWHLQGTDNEQTTFGVDAIVTF